MKILMVLAVMVFAQIASADDFCTKYAGKTNKENAIAKVSEDRKENICVKPLLLDIEIQASQYVNQDNEIVPQEILYLHFEEYSCKYEVDSTSWFVRTKRCYSTW